MGDGLRGIVPDAGLLGFGAAIGATCGTVLGPSASFGFLRRVPIGRLFGETIVGTVMGGVTGFMLALDFNAVIALAAVGFLVAGARLAWVYRKDADPQAVAARR